MNLAQYLKREGLTQKQFAKHLETTQGLDLTQGAISHWLTGRAKIAAEHVLKIEAATNGAVKRTSLRPDLYPRERAN